MSDNLTVRTDDGTHSVGTDEISGIHYTRMKIIVGPDGTNDGDVSSANPMPVVATAPVLAAQATRLKQLSLARPTGRAVTVGLTPVNTSHEDVEAGILYTFSSDGFVSIIDIIGSSIPVDVADYRITSDGTLYYSWNRNPNDNTENFPASITTATFVPAISSGYLQELP